ncbi:MAG TPA: NlpC/P60 family protein [Herpetosiphonaceae bacterium]
MPPPSLPPQRRTTIWTSLGIMLLLLPLLGCIGSATVNPMADGLPRWACPTPTALPPIPIEDGTEVNPQGTPVPRYRDTLPYEREPYNQIGRQPVLRPTPQTKSGTSFYLGQMINLHPSLDVQLTVEARGEPIVRDTGMVQLFVITARWHNRGAPVPFDPARQLVISSIRRPDGRLIGGPWRWDLAAAEAAGIAPSEAALHTQILTGERTMQVPILAPTGSVQVLDLQLDPPDATERSAGSLRVQFTAAEDPDCAHAGTVAAVYDEAGREAVPPPAPVGGDRLVGFALQQLGRQYCWGGKGWSTCSGWTPESGQVTPPCASYPCWDCSGLTWGAYTAAGIVIGHGTANQKNYPAVPIDQIQPGDLLLFGGINQVGRGARITHVGLYAGDLDGDGTGDMIHAASYPTGVVIAKNILGNRYYRERLAIITRPPRGGA